MTYRNLYFISIVCLQSLFVYTAEPHITQAQSNPLRWISGTVALGSCIVALIARHDYAAVCNYNKHFIPPYLEKNIEFIRKYYDQVSLNDPQGFPGVRNFIKEVASPEESFFRSDAYVRMITAHHPLIKSHQNLTKCFLNKIHIDANALKNFLEKPHPSDSSLEVNQMKPILTHCLNSVSARETLEKNDLLLKKSIALYKWSTRIATISTGIFCYSYISPLWKK